MNQVYSQDIIRWVGILNRAGDESEMTQVYSQYSIRKVGTLSRAEEESEVSWAEV